MVSTIPKEDNLTRLLLFNFFLTETITYWEKSYALRTWDHESEPEL